MAKSKLDPPGKITEDQLDAALAKYVVHTVPGALTVPQLAERIGVGPHAIRCTYLDKLLADGWTEVLTRDSHNRIQKGYVPPKKGKE